MRKTSAFIPKLLVILWVGLPLMGCDVYTQNNPFGSSSSSSCGGANCNIDRASLLKIETVSRVLVKSGQTYVDVGGSCNEGGFSGSLVTWEILQNGFPLRRCQEGISCGRCLNGRFSMLLDFSGFGAQNTMNVRLEIIGFDQRENPSTNSVWGLKTIPVLVF